MRSVLLYANRDAGTIDRLEVALTVAAAFNSHIHCLQVTPYNNFVVMDPFGGVYGMAEMLADIREREIENQNELQARLERAGASWTWINENGDPQGAALDRMDLMDLAGVSTGGEGDLPDHAPAAAKLATRTDTPILAVASDGPRIDVGGNVMVAWNGSPEVSRALRHAVPLLKFARNVTIVRIAEDRAGRPLVDAAQYLSYHDIKSEIREQPRDDEMVHDALRRAALELEANYIVMGAYGRPHLRERMFGGVTLDFSQHSPCSLFMSH